MAIALDGFGALRRIGEARKLFAPARGEADKAARAIVGKCLKAKTLDLETLRALRAALGDETFALIAHEAKPAETLALLKRLDKHRADLKTMAPDARAQHLVALADATAEPAGAPAHAKKAAARPRAPKRIESELMTAFAKGGRQDD